MDKVKIISIFLTRFPIGGLGEPNIYHDLGEFTRFGDFTRRVVKMILLLTEYRYWSNRYGRK